MTSGELSLSALIRLGKEVSVKYNKAADFAADLTAARASESAFHGVRIHRLHELTPAQNSAHHEAGQYIVNSKTMMSGAFGSEYNQSWEGVGYMDYSLATPRPLAQRMALLERIATYLATHPQFENEPLNVTAEKGAALYQRYTTARDAVLASKSEEKRLSQARKATRAALRKRIRSLQKELGQILEDDDPRWLSFGLTPPADIKEKRRNARRAKQLERAAGTSLVATPASAPKAPSEELPA